MYEVTGVKGIEFTMPTTTAKAVISTTIASTILVSSTALSTSPSTTLSQSSSSYPAGLPYDTKLSMMCFVILCQELFWGKTSGPLTFLLKIIF